MHRKYLVILFLLFVMGFSPLNSQENKNILDFGHRITIGHYDSYANDNIGIAEAGFDFILNFPYIKPNYNIMDFGIGLSGLFAFDSMGNIREPVLGLGVNGSMRIYTPSMRANTDVFGSRYELGIILKGLSRKWDNVKWRLAFGWRFRI